MTDLADAATLADYELEHVTFCGCTEPALADRVCTACGLVNLGALLAWAAALCPCGPDADLELVIAGQVFPARVCQRCGRTNAHALLTFREESSFTSRYEAPAHPGDR
jgi:hypothetical protein